MIDWEIIENTVALMPDGTMQMQSILLKHLSRKQIDRILTLAEDYIYEENGTEYIDWQGVREEFEGYE